MGSLPLLTLCILLASAPLRSAERDALQIDDALQDRHIPFGTVLNPIFSLDRSSIVAYTRGGDSALFTGLYLAAESFRFRVNPSPEALRNMHSALRGITLLTDITGLDLLARCAAPTDSPYAAGIASEEKTHGVYQASVNGKPWIWIGNTSRDQYTGVFFGLAAAYDVTLDRNMRTAIRALVTRLLGHLIDSSWNIVMPDGSVSTTFLIRPDQQLAFLQIGRRVNPERFGSQYSRAAATQAFTVPVPLGIDASNDRTSYFKFNLAFLNLYNLIRFEENSGNRSWYERGYDAVRNTTDNHRNAFFNMVDRALHGANDARDAETRAILDAWLKRPRGDYFVDLRGKVPTCGDANEACNPVPVEQRPPSDFLWQLNPFQLWGGGNGTIETAGIDYLLPYWMGRLYGVIAEPRRGPVLYRYGQ